MVLVLVFSFGLAIVVSAVGIAVILMGDRLAGRVDQGVLTTWLPRFSAAVVTLVGLGISLKGVDAVWTIFVG
jgi:ABC-type nickel/cobalt efflux system permease component RcnA